MIIMHRYDVEVLAYHKLDGSAEPCRMRIIEGDREIILHIKRTVGKPSQRANLDAGVQGLCYDCIIAGNEHRQAWLYDDNGKWALVVN